MANRKLPAFMMWYLSALLLLLLAPPAWATEATVSRPSGKIDFTVREDQGSFNLRIDLVSPCLRPLCTLNYTTRDGSAIAGRDYVATSGSLTWAEDDVSPRTITIPIIDNDIADGNRTFSIVYSSPDGSVTALDGNVDTVTIIDDESGPTPPQFTPVVIITEPGGPLTVDLDTPVTFNAIASSDNPDANLVFNWNFGAGADPASSQSAGPVTVVFNTPGARTVTLTVTDSTVNLSATASIAVTVRDEEPPEPPKSPVVEQLEKFATSPGQVSMADVIGTVCPQGIVSADLQRDCNALIGAAFAEDASTGGALAVITPDQASAPSDSSLTSVQLQTGNVGARLAALRAGSTQLFSLHGLSLDVAGTTVSGQQMQSLLEALGGGASADDPGFSRLGVFVSGRFSSGDRDRTTNVEGFDYDVLGLTVGVDYRLTDNFILGGALGYAKLDTDIDADRGTLDADNYSFTLFGTWYRDDSFFVDGSFTIGRGDYDQERRMRYTLPDRAEVDQTFYSSFDGDQLGLALTAGYEIRRDALTLIPTGRLQYLKVDIDGYREDRVSNPTVDGSGWAVAIDDQSFKSFTLGLGGQATYAIGQSWGVLLPYASAEWIYEFEDGNDSVTGRFVGDPSGTSFALPVDSNDSNYFNVGVGVSAQFAGGTAGFIDYQRILGYSNLSHYSISAGVRFEF